MTSLRRAFLRYRRTIFAPLGYDLPIDCPVRWSTRMPNMGLFSPDFGILINRELLPWTAAWRLTLIHEMAHLATEEEKAEHGPRWRKLMRKIASTGALDLLW